MHRNTADPSTGDMREIAGVFASISDTSVMNAFMEEIMTPAERSTLALRWKLLKMLHHEVPQRRIAESLRISLCKITRGSKILKKNNSLTRDMLDRREKNAV